LTLALPKDPTNALRSRRWRQRQKAKAANGGATLRSVTTIEMCALAARVGDGRASPGDLALAERLIMELVFRLPADSELTLQ